MTWKPCQGLVYEQCNPPNMLTGEARDGAGDLAMGSVLAAARRPVFARKAQT